VFQLTRRSLDLHLAANLNAPFDLLAQARSVALDVVDAAIAQPAPTARRHAAATAITGIRARPAPLFMLTSSGHGGCCIASPACLLSARTRRPMLTDGASLRLNCHKFKASRNQ
jgi:hypothetical protein